MNTAHDELKEILAAINERDCEKFFAHVDFPMNYCATCGVSKKILRLELITYEHCAQ